MAVRILLPTHLFPAALVPERPGLCVLLEHPGYFRGPTGDFRLHLGRLAWLRAACASYSKERGVERVPLERAREWLEAAKRGSGTFVAFDPLDSSVRASLEAALGGRIRFDAGHPGFVVGDPAEYKGPLALKSVLLHCRASSGVMPGAASTDSENRAPPDDALRLLVASTRKKRERRHSGPVLAAAIAWAKASFPGNPGDPAAAALYPHTRRQALAALGKFLRLSLPDYGKYQDAVLVGEAFGVHSGLSAAINVGLLSPGECAVAAAKELAAGRAPRNSVEAYTRQILGWREYCRILYFRAGESLERAHFGRYPRLPDPWYSADGPLEPLSAAVRSAEATSYLGHIQRLMVANSIAVMAGAHPGGVLRWFTELVAADAHQWVMVANIAHMGGLPAPPTNVPLARRAYVSSSAYLRRMTDLPSGPWEEAVDALFYSYLERAPPGSEFYSWALKGKRYTADRARWKKVARRVAAALAASHAMSKAKALK